MANSVMELLDMLYEMIDDAKGGLGGFCKIERDKALDILDEVRGRFPAEISEARKLMDTRNEYLEKAKADADRVRKQTDADIEQLRKRAEEQARKMINDNEIMAGAKAQGAHSGIDDVGTCFDALEDGHGSQTCGVVAVDVNRDADGLLQLLDQIVAGIGSQQTGIGIISQLLH